MGNTPAKGEREVLATQVAEHVDVGRVGRQHEGSHSQGSRSFRSALSDRGAYQTVRQIVQQGLLESFVDLAVPTLPPSPWWREPGAIPTLAAQIDCCNHPSLTTRLSGSEAPRS